MHIISIISLILFISIVPVYHRLFNWESLYSIFTLCFNKYNTQQNELSLVKNKKIKETTAIQLKNILVLFL